MDPPIDTTNAENAVEKVEQLDESKIETLNENVTKETEKDAEVSQAPNETVSSESTSDKEAKVDDNTTGNNETSENVTENNKNDGSSDTKFEELNILGNVNETSTQNETVNGVDGMSRKAKIRISNLPKELTKEAIHDKFSAFGSVSEVSMPSGSEKYVYVTMEQKIAAESAIKGLGDIAPGIEGKLVATTSDEAKISKVKLFVGHLPRDYYELQVENIFEEFGRLVDVFVLRYPKKNCSKGCAFVTFDNEESAAKAIEKLDGKLSLPGVDKSISVTYAREDPNQKNRVFNNLLQKQSATPSLRGGRGGMRGRGRGRGGREMFDSRDRNRFRDNSGGNNNFDQRDSRNRSRSRERIYQSNVQGNYNQNYGNNNMGGQQQWNNNNPNMQGYNNSQGYNNPPNNMQQMPPNNMPPNSMPPNNMQNSNNMMGGNMQSQNNMGQQNNYGSTNQSMQGGNGYNNNSGNQSNDFTLIVDGLPGSCQDAHLIQVCGHYGNVIKASVQQDPTNPRHASGYVTYGTYQEAATALHTLNGNYVFPGRNSPITLEFASNNFGGQQQNSQLQQNQGGNYYQGGNNNYNNQGGNNSYNQGGNNSYNQGGYNNYNQGVNSNYMQGGNNSYNQGGNQQGYNQNNGGNYNQGNNRYQNNSSNSSDRGGGNYGFNNQGNYGGGNNNNYRGQYQQNNNEQNEKLFKLYVSGIPYASSSDDVKELFSRTGNVASVHVIRDHLQQSKGSAFVLYYSRQEAQNAINAFNGQCAMDPSRAMRVDFAKQKPGYKGAQNFLER